MEYGAFVDLGGVDGLIHVSDISYSRVDNPADHLKVGDKVNVKVLKIDLDKGRISLGLKQIEPDPWSLVAQSLFVGDQVNGRVTRTAPFGAFIEVDKGVEGLCPISELSWKRVNRVEDVLAPDQVHMFKIMEIDPVKRRLSLSLKQSGGDPWVGAAHTYQKHAIVEGTVLSCTEFGAFVELKVGVEGLVHISELDNKRVNQVTDVLKPGDVKQFRVLTVDEDQRRISLSLKQVAALTEEVRAAERAAYEERQAAANAAGGGRPGGSVAPAKRKPSGNMKGGLGKSGALGMGLGDLKL
jgi:small subunit ribosomal protein S1